MRELLLIGIGTGNPDHLTFQAAEAMAQADVILIPRKGRDKADLADIRQQICDRVLPVPGPEIIEFDLPVRDTDNDYLQSVDDWHDAVAQAWAAAMSRGNEAGQTAALLIWGDPSLYDSSLRIASRLDPAPYLRVIPGLTSLQVLTAAHAMPINDIGKPFQVTTGRQLRDNGWPEGVGTVAVMLDGQCSFTALDAQEFDIWWGAYVGMPEEILLNGALSEIGETIVKTRAKARAQHGWIMDIYVLKRRDA